MKNLIYNNKFWTVKNLMMLVLIFELINLASCKKFLEAKPQQTQVVPTTLIDLQGLLDNINYINQNRSPRLTELIADNFYVSTTSWQTELSTYGIAEPNNYIWDKNATDLVGSWTTEYQGPIYYSNVVLDNMPAFPTDSSGQISWNSIKGSALFYRAFAFCQLAQLYCRPYSEAAKTDPGIILKLKSDINEKLTRSTVEETYNQIINDLKDAVKLLPQTTLYPSRPNQAAAYGLLARTYLFMRDYSNAGLYADLCLRQKNQLLDFNTVSTTASRPFSVFNVEVIYHDYSNSADLTIPTYGAMIDSNLYNSYDNNDLRKAIFFKANADGTHYFSGSYLGKPASVIFDGITTDEMYLTRAECYARANNINAAMTDLNALMVKRWKNDGSFVPFSALNSDQAKNLVLQERRKELVFRTLRWPDIRRLNLEGANITLTRVINGTTYTLPPNDLRTVILIPQEVINLNPNIQQNPR